MLAMAELLLNPATAAVDAPTISATTNVMSWKVRQKVRNPKSEIRNPVYGSRSRGFFMSNQLHATRRRLRTTHAPAETPVFSPRARPRSSLKPEIRTPKSETALNWSGVMEFDVFDVGEGVPACRSWQLRRKDVACVGKAWKDQQQPNVTASIRRGPFRNRDANKIMTSLLPGRNA